MVVDEKQKGNMTIEIDPKEIHEGTCHIKKLGSGKVAICKENGIIKILEVEKEIENGKAEIDPKEIHEGACHLKELRLGKVAICKEKGKIKFSEVEKEE